MFDSFVFNRVAQSILRWTLRAIGLSPKRIGPPLTDQMESSHYSEALRPPSFTITADVVCDLSTGYGYYGTSRKLIPETSPWRHTHSLYRYPYRPISVGLKTQDELTVVLSDHPNYYHWLLEEVPAFIMSVERLKEEGRNFRVIAPKIARRPVRQLAELLDIEIHLQRRVVRLSQAAITGKPSALSPAAWAVESLAALTRAHERTSKPSPSQLFISRASASREFVRMEELFDKLDSPNFPNRKLIELDRMLLGDQIRAFREGNVIVAEHGAGLANLVFCQKGTIVIELRKRYQPSCFKAICDLQGLNHVPIAIEDFDGDYAKLRQRFADVF